MNLDPKKEKPTPKPPKTQDEKDAQELEKQWLERAAKEAR